MTTDTTVAIHQSARLADCEERAFVLTAVGISSEILWNGDGFALHVDAAHAEAARAHLARYETESRPAPPPPPPPRGHPGAWIGCALYVAVILGVARAVAQGVGRLDAFWVGALDAAAIRAGEWWRAWTALTLHVDVEHLVANLGAGVWFGYLAGRRVGPGIAWALIVTAAAASNLAEALLGPPAHRAVGASTAVFAALGLLAAYTWRERYAPAQRWARRWGPLVAGVVLLGWTGTQGEHTDVIAHAGGFALGALTGAVAALPAARRALERVPQWAAGAVALGSVALAWALALAS